MLLRVKGAGEFQLLRGCLCDESVCTEFLWPQCNHRNPGKQNRVTRDPESVTLYKKELTSHGGFEDGKSYEPRNTSHL